MPDIDRKLFTDHSELLALTAEEMQRQVVRWQPINGHAHPLLDIDSPPPGELRNREAQAKANNDVRVVDGTLDWYGILEEEFYEAFAEQDPAKVVTELVQCAAVALSAARSVQRYGLGGKTR